VGGVRNKKGEGSNLRPQSAKPRRVAELPGQNMRPKLRDAKKGVLRLCRSSATAEGWKSSQRVGKKG